MKTLMGMKPRTAVLRGLKTAWLDNENPSGDIVLFIHGYLDTPDAWSAQAQALGEGRRLLLACARGVGDSEPPADRGRYGAYSILLDHLELLRLADPEGLRPVHVVGHDVGGVHAWMLATHPSPPIRSVAVLNSAHPRQYLRRLLWPRQLLKSWYVGAFQIPYLSEAALWIFHREVLRAMEAEGWRPPAGEFTLRDFEGAAFNAMNQYRQFARDIPAFLRETVRPTEVPVLVVSSEEDRYLEEPSRPEFDDIARRVTIRVVRGRHWLQREQPERINKLLLDFWEAQG